MGRDLDYKENWRVKNWCFWIVVLDKSLESPLESKEIKSVSPKEINPEYWLGGLMLKLKLQYFGYLMWRTDTLEKTLMLEGLKVGGEGVNREWDGWMASPTQWTRVWVDSGSWWWTGRPGVLWFMGSQRVGHDWVTELNRNLITAIHEHGLPIQLFLFRLLLKWNSRKQRRQVDLM